jgi:hypothetical protein
LRGLRVGSSGSRSCAVPHRKVLGPEKKRAFLDIGDSDEIDHCFRGHFDHSFRGHADQDRSEATLAFVILEK